jgi:hypothetical protein
MRDNGVDDLNVVMVQPRHCKAVSRVSRKSLVASRLVIGLVPMRTNLVARRQYETSSNLASQYPSSNRQLRCLSGCPCICVGAFSLPRPATLVSATGQCHRCIRLRQRIRFCALRFGILEVLTWCFQSEMATSWSAVMQRTASGHLCSDTN